MSAIWSFITTVASWLPGTLLVGIALTAIIAGLLSGGITRAATVLLTVGALSAWGGWQVNAWRHQVKDAQRVAQELADARKAQADQMVIVRNAERISDEQSKKEAKRLVDVVAGKRALASLRNEIDRLKARELPPDPSAAAFALEARAARDLLGECSAAYQRVDERAQGLGDQVEGLQAFAIEVCKAGQGGPITPASAP